MGAFTITSVKSVANPSGMRQVMVECTGPASYDTGGSVIDLSPAAVVGSGTLGMESGFVAVHGAALMGVGASGTAKFEPFYIPAASDAPATGKLMVRDLTAASDAEVPSTTDLSSHTFRFLITGK